MPTVTSVRESPLSLFMVDTESSAAAIERMLGIVIEDSGAGGGEVGVYCASLLFDEEMMVEVSALLERHSDSVRWVASLQRLPRNPSPPYDNALRLDAVLHLPM